MNVIIRIDKDQIIRVYKHIRRMFNFFAHHKVLEGDYNLADIVVEEELGRGNSHVYTAQIKQRQYALKQIEIKSDYEYQKFLKEITFMKELSDESKWIVKYEGYLLTKMERNQYEKNNYAFIVMECAESNFEQYLSQKKACITRLKVSEMERIIEQLVVAFASLEEKNIAHCDIKPENILIMDSHQLSIKLCDVGSCKIVSAENIEEATILGTVPFLAPELVKIKANKIVSLDPFKSDVFSFGLVILYLITFKKFKSHERLEVQELTYKEIIQEWIKQAKEIIENQGSISEMLKLALDFDEFKRPKFKDLRNIFLNQRKKKAFSIETFVNKLREEESRFSNLKMQETQYFQSVNSNHINLFKSRKTDKFNVTKTTTSGTGFRLIKANTNTNNHNNLNTTMVRNNNSPSPLSKRTISLVSTSSPEKTEKGTVLNWSFLDMNQKIVYITEETKDFLPEEFTNQQDKIFVLAIPFVKFTKAEAITIMPSCTFEIFYLLPDVDCKRLFLECIDIDSIGIEMDAPMLKFQKIRANFSQCRMAGGFEGIFRILANENLQLLELRLTQSQASFKQLIYLVQRLQTQCPKLNSLLINWQRQIFTEQQHFTLTEKIAKLPIKKLILIMNENYIKYEKINRWQLPKQCEVLYLDYAHNLLDSIVGNLSISLANSNIKQLYLNLENNNLTKGEINLLIKAITSIKSLDKLMLNFAFNKIQDLKYLETVLLELLTISSLEIKLHRTDLTTATIVELIDCLKELFEFNLKILRISCNRSLPLQIFRSMIEDECIFKSTNKSKIICCDIVGFDNQQFMIYLKKKDKHNSGRTKGGPACKKKQSLLDPIKKERVELPKLKTMDTTYIENFNSNGKVTGVCTQQYTMTESFYNYLCIECSEKKEMSKYTFYCKYCITSCQHKQHNFVKVNERTKCSCAYSGCCHSDVKPILCAEKLISGIKKQYRCFKCEISFCLACIETCKENHKEWIQEGKELSHFKCKTKF